MNDDFEKWFRSQVGPSVYYQSQDDIKLARLYFQQAFEAGEQNIKNKIMSGYNDENNPFHFEESKVSEFARKAARAFMIGAVIGFIFYLLHQCSNV